MHESVSPKSTRTNVVNNNHRIMRQNVHTAVPKKKYMNFNNENVEPRNTNINFKYREKIQRKKDIIIEEEEDNDEKEYVESINNDS